MPRAKRIPVYALHKPSGQARVIIDGTHHYLGVFGSPESREKYARLITQQFAVGGAPETKADDAANTGPAYPVMPINELVMRYLQFAATYYVRDGEPTGEVDNLKDAIGRRSAPRRPDYLRDTDSDHLKAR